jgi:hypothetical protein
MFGSPIVKEEEKKPVPGAPIQPTLDAKTSRCATSWKKAFFENKTLIHVDISHNNFKKYEVFTIGEGLENNHSIMGIHMIGNEGTADSLGFVNAN